MVRIEAKVNPRIKSLGDLAKWTPPELRTVRDRIDAQFRTNERRLFASEGASGGGRWLPNKEPYRTFKRKRGKRKVMQFDGDLRKGLTQKGHRDHVATFGNTPKRGPFVRVGTRNVVAAFHAPAINNPLRNKSLPVRDPLQMTHAQERTLVGVWAEYMIKTKLPRIFRVLQASAPSRG